MLKSSGRIIFIVVCAFYFTWPQLTTWVLIYKYKEKFVILESIGII